MDLFSGSGAIGLEAASRGSKKVIMCDKSKDAIKIINKNIEKTHLKEMVELYNLDYETLLKTKIQKTLDIVYIDPPYDSNYAINTVKILIDKNLINENSMIIIETDIQEKIINELEKLSIEIDNVRKYGRVSLIFLKYNNL